MSPPDSRSGRKKEELSSEKYVSGSVVCSVFLKLQKSRLFSTYMYMYNIMLYRKNMGVVPTLLIQPECFLECIQYRHSYFGKILRLSMGAENTL